MKKNRTKIAKGNRRRKDVIAYRKACNVQGTGLSHYILMDKKTR